jgi:hypothetical protein
MGIRPKLVVTIGKLEMDDVQTNGLQTVINNGLQVLDTAIDFIKDLFK